MRSPAESFIRREAAAIAVANAIQADIGDCPEQAAWQRQGCKTCRFLKANPYQPNPRANIVGLGYCWADFGREIQSEVM